MVSILLDAAEIGSWFVGPLTQLAFDMVGSLDLKLKNVLLL